MKLKILFLLIAISISACENSEDSNLVGNWITESCGQYQDTNLNFTQRWGKSIYEFTSDNTVIWNSKAFSDSQCINPDETLHTSIRTDPLAVYKYLGKAITEEGVEGYEVHISLKAPEGYLPFEEGFYVLENDRLCFSKIFRFDALNFGRGENSKLIDFEECLINIPSNN